jgi:hypothetical protein
MFVILWNYSEQPLSIRVFIWELHSPFDILYWQKNSDKLMKMQQNLKDTQLGLLNFLIFKDFVGYVFIYLLCWRTYFVGLI